MDEDKKHRFALLVLYLVADGVLVYFCLFISLDFVNRSSELAQSLANRYVEICIT